MGGPMMIRTSKVCAGPATARKQGASASNDSNYHQLALRGGGGQISVAGRPKDRRPTLPRIAAGLKTFFSEYDLMIDR